MFADYLPLTEESEIEVLGVFEEWKAALAKGLKVSMEKTKLMVTDRVKTRSPIRKMAMWLLR